MTQQSAESDSAVKVIETQSSTARSSAALTTAACGLLAIVAGGTLDVPPAYAEVHTITQSFVPPWNGVHSPDGLWRINGPWNGTNNNEMDPTLAKIFASTTGQKHGYLSLSVAANQLRGSELQTMNGAAGSNTQGYGYGYYETFMRVTTVPGVVASFFWIEAPNYGSHEWDVEFTTNESWINSPNSGLVHLTLHPEQYDVRVAAGIQSVAGVPPLRLPVDRRRYHLHHRRQGGPHLSGGRPQHARQRLHHGEHLDRQREFRRRPADAGCDHDLCRHVFRRRR